MACAELPRGPAEHGATDITVACKDSLFQEWLMHLHQGLLENQGLGRAQKTRLRRWGDKHRGRAKNGSLGRPVAPAASPRRPWAPLSLPWTLPSMPWAPLAQPS